MTPKPAILIALPTGLTMGGVQVWAARLANGLAQRGRRVGLILHAPTTPELDIELHPAIQITRVESAPPLADANGDLAPFLPYYQQAVTQLHAATGLPVICLPCHLGDCFGIFAALSQIIPNQLRVVGWRHSAIPYDLRTLEWYEPLLTELVAVSDFLEQSLRNGFAAPDLRISNIPCGVETRTSPRPPRAINQLLRLIYVGRLDEDIKRVSALPILSDELWRRKIPHHLTIVGDGPAAAGLDAALGARDPDRFTRVSSAPPREVSALLDRHDIFVLPSRVEGLSVSMLEAMAAGCVPVVTRTESGAAQVIDGRNGIVVDAAGPQITDVADALADGVCAALPRLAEMSAAAIATINARYSLSRHLDAVEKLIDRAASAPARQWPRTRPCAFTSKTGPSGAVPPDGPDRLRIVLESLRGRRVIIHGTGRHTIELSAVLDAYKDRIIAYTDDDPARHGGRIAGLPIIPPEQAALARATDVVISSWMNQDVIWRGRAVYERQCVAVHRVYGEDQT